MDIPYCPIAPTEKQSLFLECKEQEVFFGGAAGGGKSVALLMGALMYVHIPGYAALIVRKDLPRLALPGGLIPRSHEWLAGRGGVVWNGSRRQWSFDTGGDPATVTFGFLSRPLDRFRYASSEFQYIAFDELTDFEQHDYRFLFSRLRKVKALDVPLRMRSASNPGGVGHVWVRERFIAQESGVRGQESGANRDCRYIPSRIADNPYLDEEEYRGTLAHLPALERERLMNGDWSVQEKGLFDATWLRYFVEHAGQLELQGADGRILATIADGSCRRFATIDPAGTSAERTREARGRGACWSVIQVWDRPPRELGRFLLLRHQTRGQFGFDQLCAAIRRVHHQWRPLRLWIEREKLGQAVIDSLEHELPIQGVATGGQDKVARAGPLMLKFERGEVFLPKYDNAWRQTFEAELLAWTGVDGQPSDQIDAAAYAALVLQHEPSGPIVLPMTAAG